MCNHPFLVRTTYFLCFLLLNIGMVEAKRKRRKGTKVDQKPAHWANMSPRRKCNWTCRNTRKKCALRCRTSFCRKRCRERFKQCREDCKFAHARKKKVRGRSRNRRLPSWTKQMQEIRRVLRGMDLKKKYIAIRALGTKGKKGIPILLKLLANPHPKIVAKAQAALLQIGKPSIPALIKVLKNKKWATKELAAETLGKFGPKAIKALPALKRLAKDKDEDVRNTAKEAIQRIKQKKTKP